MRGGWDMMSSTCVSSAGGGALPRSLVAGAGVVGTVYGTHHSGAQIMEARSPAPAWHMHNTANTVKQEPMDHDSSAYGSGSDGFHSSSPTSSDHNSRDSNPPPVPYAPITHDIPISHYYSTPVTNRSIPVMSYQQPHGFNPLTPPSFDPMVSPKIQISETQSERKLEDVPAFTKDPNTTLTPCTTPPNEVTPPKSPKNTEEDGSYFEEKPEDHLRRLQMAFERNGMLPESPKGSETRDSADEDDDMDEVDEQGLRIPRVNSHGKVKTFKCKQCEFVAVTKLDFWEHSRGHIKAEKLLTCPKCPFVTEYKHHLEYHLRNHFGSKPFKCDKCSYSCVNKSMLNSHLKSHSNVYQYRCSDCTYATKYCHSLKLHLRKYKHSPAMVLNPDGTPNPLPIIDVYGTRRGPKSKSTTDKEMTSPPPQNPQTSPNYQQHSLFPHFMLPNSQQPPMSLPFPYGPLLGAFPGALGSPFAFPHMNHEQLSPRSNDRSTPESLKIDEDAESIRDEEEQEEPPKEALDLSKPEVTLPITVPEPIQCQKPVQTPQVSISTGKNRRKGRAFKLERIQQGSSSDEEHDEILENITEPEVVVKVIEPSIKKADIFNCQYCDIAFRDVVMYTMHMGYHGYKDPFTCNMCGEQSSDKVSFFLHIARTSHS